MHKDKLGKNKWKIVSGVVVVALAATGTGLTVATYRDKGFQPDKYTNERQKKDNQIVFPGQDVAMDEDGSDESEMWERDDNAEDNLKPEDRSSAPMLFQTKKVADADTDPGKESSDGDTADEVYSSKKDKKKDNGDKTITDSNGGGDRTGVDDGTGDGKRPGNTDGKPGKSDGDPGNGNKPGNNDGSDDNKPGNGDDKPGNDNKPGKDDNDPGSDEKPGKVDDDPANPDPGALDVDTTVPSLPKDDVIIPADPYPGDDNIDINDEEYKRYSLFVIGIQNDADRVNCLYMGEYLNDQRVLCSVLVYVCVDGVPKYRLTELGDNFQIGAYPDQINTDTVDVTFRYRPGEDYEWIEGTYSYPILYSGKLLLKGWNDGEYAEQYLVPYTDPDIKMFSYYSDMTDSISDPIDRLFLGWSETEGGKSVGPFYTFEDTGAKVMYPVSANRNSLCSSVEWNKVGLDINGMFNYPALQTLKEYSQGEDVLDIQDGIQYVDLPVDIDWDTWELVVPTYSVVKVPASMMLLGGSYGSVSQAASYSFRVQDRYEVDEDNQVYSSYDGMLLNKDQTCIYSIPSNIKEVNVPETVQEVNFSAGNNITEIHMNSQKPINMDFNEISGAKIYVPASSYIRYLSAWGKNPGGSNMLLPDNGQEQQVVEDDQAIYSADGETLISVKSSVDGVYVVKSGVKYIVSGALENCGQIDIMILPESISRLESGSLTDNPPGKIVFLGDTAPVIEKGTFGNTTVLQVQKSAKSSYGSAWSSDLCNVENICYREFNYVDGGQDGFKYLDEKACDNDGAGAILIKAAGDITYFDSESVPGVSWKMIASRAFADCGSLYMAELPDTVKSIGRSAFAGCTNLQGVVSYAKDSVTVDDGAFDNTWNLRFVAFNAADLGCYLYNGGASFFAPSNGVGYTGADRFSPYYFLENADSGKLLYGKASDDKGEAAEGSYLLGATLDVSGDIRLREDILEIASNVFTSCTNEFTITGMDDIVAIGGDAFRNSGITGNVNIPSTCVYVGDYAFSGCTGITDVVIDGSSLNKAYYVDPLGSNVFSWCTGLERVTIKGTGYYDLCENAFMGCTSLTSIEIDKGAGIDTVSYGALGMTAISEITLPEKLKGIGYGAFDSCGNLKKVNLTGTSVPELLVYGPGMQFNFGSDLPEKGWLTVPEGCEQAYIDTWKYYMYGWTPDNPGDLTDDQLLEGENMVRAYMGLDPRDTQEPVDKSDTEWDNDDAKVQEDKTTEDVAEENKDTKEKVDPDEDKTAGDMDIAPETDQDDEMEDREDGATDDSDAVDDGDADEDCNAAEDSNAAGDSDVASDSQDDRESLEDEQ